ncbi:MAG: transporter substrate-binding protein [Halioglobus sp.]|nr:transporter substrate-binding protein [Halioglobus sp.]
MAVVNDPMEATYIGIHLWRQAVELAGTTDPLSVKERLGNLRFQAPSGYESRVDPKNHHLYKPVFLGRANTSG